MFSRIIYLFAVIDVVLISSFYYKLSDLSPEAYLASGHYAAFGFWIDYLLVNIFLMIFLPTYLHYKRHDFGDEFGETFHINHSLHKKIATAFFCNVLPFFFLIGMLIFCIRYWP